MQKIFDFHAHVFPDEVAERATEHLHTYYKVPIASRGTRAEFNESRHKNPDIAVSLIHSTATKASQVTSVNSFVAEMTSENVLGFGTVHPLYEDISSEIDRIISLGLRGIKLHPDFQHFNVDDERALEIYRCAEGRLPILFHAGDENSDYSSPRRIRRIHDMFPRLTIIAAHLGGYRAWDESIKYLVGTNVYFDTSSSTMFLSQKEVLDIIRAHGVEKCLFGTDFPMHDPREEIERFMSIGLNEKERSLILWDNAVRLLGYENNV